MSNKEKIAEIKKVLGYVAYSEYIYIELLEKLGDTQRHYYDYVTTNVDEELKRLPTADYHLCCCLLTLLLREDHFSNGSFGERYRSGVVTEILNRMILLLSETE